MNYENSPQSTSPLRTVELGSHEWFNGLRDLLAACGAGTNKNDRVEVLIAACISDGLDTGSRIIGVAKLLGFHPRHAGKTLNLGTGNNPRVNLWRRSDEGQYSLHSEAADATT